MVVVSDFHCGHQAGLTPPGWQFSTDSSDASRKKYGEHQRYLWDFYYTWICRLKPIEILAVNGDAIDGKGPKTGGTEQITTDRVRQMTMAKECIEVAEAKKIIMTHGTGYHVGSEDDFETPLAKSVGADIVSHHDFSVNGTVFNFRHKIATSTIPHGRNTAAARTALWDLIWSVKKGKVRADVLIRSHAHYFIYQGDTDTLAIITPGLQGVGSKFGTRECEGIVDIGITWFDIEEDGTYEWQTKLLDMKPMIDDPTEL